MFPSLDLKEIEKYFLKKIYERGLLIFNDNKVIEIGDIEEQNILFGKVKGTNNNIYIVRIYYKNDKITDAICTCAYAKWCKHTAAVLIYHSLVKDTNVILNKDYSENEKFKSEVKESIYKIKNRGSVFSFLNSFKSLKDKKDKEKIFYPIYYLSFDGIKQKWKILPGMYSLRKNGRPTKIKNYDSNYEITSFLDSKIDKLFKNLIEYKFSSLYYLENIIDDILILNIPIFFFKASISDGPINFNLIKEIHIDFRVKRLDLENGFFYFGSLISLVINNDEIINFSGISEENFIFTDEILLVIQEHKNLVAYLKDKKNKDIFLFLKKVKKFYNFSITDINKIRDIIKERKWEEKIKLDFNQEVITVIENYNTIPILDVNDEFYLSANKDAILAQLIFKYEEQEIDINSQHLYVNSKPVKTLDLKLYKRNLALEVHYKNILFNILGNVIEEVEYNFFHRVVKYLIKTNFQNFLREYGEKLISEGFEIRYNGEVTTYSRGTLFISITSDIDWLRGKLKYEEDNMVTDIVLELNSLLEGKIFVNQKIIYLTKENIDLLRKLCNEGMDNYGNIKISKLDFSLIRDLSTIIENKDIWYVQQAEKILKSIEDFSGIENIVIPQSFKGNLREYQQLGVNWLNFLYTYNLNGCLADDMGLGKTVQTIAFLSFLFDKKEIEFVLIVAPVSTLINWQIEFNRFAPDLRLMIHQGSVRKKDRKDFEIYQIIITSYHTLRNDIEIFKDMNFDYLILDESQNIKNHTSLIFRTVKIIKSLHRLALSGTPIENHTMELWSLMHFLNPGLLGTAKEFKKKYAIPIERDNSKEKALRLANIVLPFILRRNKKDVLKDLPDKEEIIYYCEMQEDQRKVYEAVLTYYRTKVFLSINENGLENSMICILEGLLRLRQVALFASLIDKSYSNITSCKFDSFTEVLEDILRENHKVLIFSQFVEVLKILENFVKEKEFKYCYLDGSTIKRENEIFKFQRDDEVKIFLLSLKAGGVGINLTKADYVIIFDPWWNPAVESQAIDRCYRIGQLNKVIAYKFIVKDTIEEKIILLQEKKKNLFKDLISEDSSFLSHLSKDDIIALFE